MTSFFSIYWRSDLINCCYCTNIDFVNILLLQLLIYQIVIKIYEVLTKRVSLHIYLLLLCLGQVHLYFGYTSLYWLVSRTICSVVTCEGGIYLLALNPLPSQNPGSLGTSPLGLTSVNRKNLPIEVTLGGIGSVTPVCLFTSAFYPNYKLCDNKTLSHLPL